MPWWIVAFVVTLVVVVVGVPLAILGGVFLGTWVQRRFNLSTLSDDLPEDRV